MNELMPFYFEEQQVRVFDKAGEYWFVAKDVAHILGYRDAHNLARMVDEEDTDTHIRVSAAGSREVLIVNESGLYTGIIRSRRKEAKPFRRWVTDEVLPSIRKTGGYNHNPEAKKANVSTSDLNTLSKTSTSLMSQLKSEACEEVRRVLHAQLTIVCETMNIEPPTIDAISNINSEANEFLNAFWSVYEHLVKQKRLPVNHAAGSGHIAINLNQFEKVARAEGITPPPSGLLKKWLKHSATPKYMGQKSVNSTITGRTVRCWLFEHVTTMH